LWKQLFLPVALVIGAVAGAKLPVVLASADWVADGWTLTTALVVGYLMVETTRVACLLPPSARDRVALPLSLALVVVRLSCFAHGCCRGAETTLFWAVDFGDGVRRHPTQLYESCFHLLSAVVIMWLWRRAVWPGQILRLYLVAYCLFRFATEWIRLEPGLWLGMTYSQWVVALFAAVLLLLYRLDVHTSGPASPHSLGERSVCQQSSAST
jgi:prolipoprotein diacylglyceryltransferase